MERKILDRSIPEPNSGCWLWLGAVNGVYGIIHTGKVEYAHRTSFQVFVRPLESHELACHRCDNTYCVNPEHIFPGTYRDNHYDAMAKGRWSHGERHGMAVLKEYQVTAIRELFSDGATSKDIAAEYGVGEAQIRRIVSGRAWKHAGGVRSPNRRQDVILSASKVAGIRHLKNSTLPRKEIAASFGISLPTLYAVWSNRIWKM